MNSGVPDWFSRAMDQKDAEREFREEYDRKLTEATYGPMNNDLHFSSKTDEWATPQKFYDDLNEKYRFTLDPCATDDNHKCEKYYTEKTDGLAQSWKGERVFMNPPYSRGLQKYFVQKAYLESIVNPEDTFVVALLPARTDTRLFWDYCYQKSNVRIEFIQGRLKFGGSKNAAPFPSMLVIFNYRLADNTMSIPIYTPTLRGSF